MENKTKHTPAPWHIMSAKQMSVPYIVYVGNETIFQCYNTSDKDDAKANALLIAAAPDMLQGLQGIIKSWEVLSEGNYTPKQINDWLANDMKPEIDKAREIIKKATGDE